MGRLFMTEVEEPVYKCKHCEIELAVYEPVHTKWMVLFEYPDSYGKLYSFDECYNVVIGTDEVFIGTINEGTDNFMCEVFCVRCGSRIGLYYENGARYKYNEGNFYINRYKIQGPAEGSDNDADYGTGEESVEWNEEEA